MPASAEHHLELLRLFEETNWRALADRAEDLAIAHPDDAQLAAYAAHAARQLGSLHEGYAWAKRAVAIDPQNLFAQNRLSLLANLTGIPDEAYAAGDLVADRVVHATADLQNQAVTIVNAIHAAAKLDRIADAVLRFTAVIERLDHAELHFNSACLYTLAGDDRAFRYIRRSLATGKKKSAFDDGDFDRVRTDPRFIELLARDWVAEQSALNRLEPRNEYAYANEYMDPDDAPIPVVAPAHEIDHRADLRPEHFIDPEELRVAPYLPVDLARAPDIEAAIDAAIDDPAGYLVYADWLLERDNQRGQLILASRRCADATTESERMLAFTAFGAMFVHDARRWLGTGVVLLAQRSSARWFMGFISELVFDTGYQRRPGDTARELLDAMLSLPVCRFLRRLAIRDVFATDTMSYADVLGAFDAHPLPHLRSLAIAPDDYQLGRTTLDASELAARFPHLEELELGAGDLAIGRIDDLAPTLRRLALRTTALQLDVLAPVLATTWPQLAELELWFGPEDQCGADHSDLWRILSGLAVPAVKQLRLKNTDFTDALAVSMVTLTTAGVATLIENAAHFRHLAELDLRANSIPAEAARRLKLALPNANVSEQKDERYVSVTE
jgi:uncharacterized protein (TIGR02996 family)